LQGCQGDANTLLHAGISAGRTEVGPKKFKGVDDGWSKKARP
jgi:hypothetical protein